jgi:phage shock protein A
VFKFGAAPVGSRTRLMLTAPQLSWYPHERRRSMLDTDLEGLDPRQAAEYVLAFITTLKQTEKAVAAAQEDANLWTRRVTLARSKGDEGLAAQAQARLSDAMAKQAQLETELADLRAKVTVLKEKLTRLRMTGVKLVDADLLLAQLQMVVGPKDTLGDAMKGEEAKAALDELKKKMQ